jgi:hypothetical protein
MASGNNTEKNDKYDGSYKGGLVEVQLEVVKISVGS